MNNKMKKFVVYVIMLSFVQGYIEPSFALNLHNTTTIADSSADAAIANAKLAIKKAKAQKEAEEKAAKAARIMAEKEAKAKKEAQERAVKAEKEALQKAIKQEMAAYDKAVKENEKSVNKKNVVQVTEKKEQSAKSVKVEKLTQKTLKVEKQKVETTKTTSTKLEKKGFIANYLEQRQAKKDKEITVTAKTDINQPSVLIQTEDDKKAKDKKEENKVVKTTIQKNDVIEETKAVDLEVNNSETVGTSDLKADNAFDATPDMQASVSTNAIISVDDCVKIALENNPSILSQMMNKDIYKNKVAQAWSNYFPTLNAGVSFSKNDMMVTNFKFPMQEYNLWNTPQLGFNQLIYDFGKTGAQAGVAKKTFEAAKENLQANINDIVYQVKSAYYNLLFLQQQVEVYEDSVLQYQIHLKQAEAYYDIGSKAKIDVSTAKYNLDNTKLTLITAKNSVDDGFARLTNAMGTPEIPEFSIKDRLDKKKYDVNFDDIVQVAYESRPELMAAKKKMEASKLLVKSSKVAFLPDLKGYGSYTNGGKKPDTDYGYQIGAQLAYSNVNLYLLKKQVDEAKMTYKKDQADYEVQRQKVYLDVKQAFIQLRNAQQSIPVARSSMQVAQERYDLAAGRYKVGLGDAIELKDAQNELMGARLQYYNTLMQYHISAANVERVIGAPLVATDENL